MLKQTKIIGLIFSVAFIAFNVTAQDVEKKSTCEVKVVTDENGDVKVTCIKDGKEVNDPNCKYSIIIDENGNATKTSGTGKAMMWRTVGTDQDGAMHHGMMDGIELPEGNVDTVITQTDEHGNVTEIHVVKSTDEDGVTTKEIMKTDVVIIHGEDGDEEHMDIRVINGSEMQSEVIVEMIMNGDGIDVEDGEHGLKVIKMTIDEDVMKEMHGKHKMPKDGKAHKVEKVFILKGDCEDGIGQIHEEVDIVVDDSAVDSDQVIVRKWSSDNEEDQAKLQEMLDEMGVDIDLSEENFSGHMVIIKDVDADDAELHKAHEQKSITVNDLPITSMKIFPNPTDGIFSLEFTTEGEGKTMAHIFNIDGKQVYKKKLQNEDGRYAHQFDLTDEPTGVYLLQITQGSMQFNKKIVVQ